MSIPAPDEDEVASEKEDSDAWEGSFWEASDARDIATTLEIEYEDARGKRTRRTIRTRSFDNDLHGGLLIAYCELRGATRTFRFDRVLSAVEVSTGEVIADLREHLNVLYQSSPERSLDSLEERYRDLLRVLLFVAKADGQYRREEKVLVREVCRKTAADPRITDDMIDKLFKEMEVPSLQAFKIATGSVLDQQLCSPEELIRTCTAIVDTQSSRSAGETEALDFLERRIARYRKQFGASA